jgi:hypothetical protein
VKVMSDREFKKLQLREDEVNAWFAKAKDAVTDERTYALRRLEKTMLICTSAIVEAIWKARA